MQAGDNSLFSALLFLSLLTLPIKGFALWRAARSEQRNWFIGLLVLNTIGMLDLAYLFYFAKPDKVRKTKKLHKDTVDR